MKNKISIILFILLGSFYLSQSTIVEYFVSERYGDKDANRSFLIFNPEEALYFTVVDKQKEPAEEVVSNFNIKRGSKDYRKIDNLNHNYSLLMYPKMGSRLFLVLDQKPSVDWKISKEKTEILGYHCTKATGSFRGRHYIVWFTAAIPSSFGPWKLDGLPGLILKAEDTNGNNSYEAIKIIQNSKQGIPLSVLDYINKKDKSEIKTYQDFIQNEEVFFKDLHEKYLASLPKDTNITNSSNYRKFAKEIDFEWQEEPKKP